MNIVTPEQAGFSSERLQRLNGLMQGYTDSGRLAGIVTLLAREGEVFHFEKFGYQDLASQKPMELDTIFRFYSMTKPITSAAVMMLYEEGNFHLDDPVSEFIPELDGLKVYDGMGQTGPKFVPQQIRLRFVNCSLILRDSAMGSTRTPRWSRCIGTPISATRTATSRR